MPNSNQQTEEFKRQAAHAAVKFIDSGMVIGLGHGSTALYALEELARNLNAGALKNITGIPCSREIKKAAAELGIALSSLEEHASIDLTIDGADEVDPDLNLIKGGGGALLMEKRVARASLREIIIVDESKLSDRLGSRFALPVEVEKDGWQTTARSIEDLGVKVGLRMRNSYEPFRTDSDNLILDCDFGPIENLNTLDKTLLEIDGVVDHGLFLGLATDVIVAGQNGITHLKMGND